MTPGRIDPPLPTARDLGLAFGRLADELHDYRRRVLPRLADPGGPAGLRLDSAAEDMGANATGEALSHAGRPAVLVDGEAGGSPSYGGVRTAVAAAREALEPAARDNLLGGRLDRRGVLPDGWAWAGTRVVWSLHAMLAPWPPEEFDRRAGRIAAAVGVDAAGAEGLRRALPDVPRRRLVRAFRRMRPDEYLALAEAAVRIAPTVPDDVLLVLRTARPDPDAPGVTGPVSWLLGAAMEVRANNHFGAVWRTAVRPECRGNWRGFQAAQVFDVLYRKWLVLHELAAWGRERPWDAG